MKLSINAGNTIKNFGHVFSDSFKVVSELVQNSRRAGATLVSIDVVPVGDKTSIVIKDNGSGIADLSTLFIMSESGWDSQIQAKEHPFGMGFFSTFFVSEQVSVSSCGKSITIDSKKAIDLDDFGDVTDDDAVTAGAVITLHGATVVIHKATIEAMAKTSSIDIVFNGELLPRTHCFDVLSKQYPVVDSPFGKFVLVRPFADDFRVFVQDIKVFNYGTRSHFDLVNQLFSDSGKISVRMPDRDSIINSDEFFKEFTSWLHGYYAQSLAAIRVEMNNDVMFITEYYREVMRYAPELSLDIHYLPIDAFFQVGLPTLSENYSAGLGDRSGVSRGDDRIVSCSDYDLSAGYSAVIGTFLYHIDALMPKPDIPAQHWIWQRAAEFSIRDFKVTVVNPVTFDVSDLAYVYNAKAIACDDIRILHKPTGVTVTAKRVMEGNPNVVDILFSGFAESDDYVGADQGVGVVYDQHDNEISMSGISMVLLTKAWDYENVVTQLASYRDEFDGVDEDEIREDSETLSRQVIVASGGDVSSVLAEIIGHLPAEIEKKLEGKTATVRFERGRAIFDFAA